MALKDLIALADAKLADVFHRKEPDPSKNRAKALDRVAKAEEQFNNRSSKGRKYVKVSNNVAEFNLPFEVPGFARYVPAERVGDIFKHLRDAVSGGELDKELEAWGSGGESVGSDSIPNQRERDPNRAKRVMSDEHRAKISAATKARHERKRAEAALASPGLDMDTPREGQIIPSELGGTSGEDNSAAEQGQEAPKKRAKRMARA